MPYARCFKTRTRVKFVRMCEVAPGCPWIMVPPGTEATVNQHVNVLGMNLVQVRLDGMPLFVSVQPEFLREVEREILPEKPAPEPVRKATKTPERPSKGRNGVEIVVETSARKRRAK